MAAGRPAKYKSPEELQSAIDLYFDENDKPTISGLAYHLGFESRQSFYDAEKKPEFTYTIKKARLKIESIYETALHSNACTGAIFALKNFGWSDKQEIDHNVNIPTLPNIIIKSVE